MKRSQKIAMTLAALAVMGTVMAWPAAGQDTSPAEQKYKRTPWHLIDLWWEFEQDANLESFGVDVAISDEVPEDVKLYISPIGIGWISGTQFYGGLQTQADGYPKNERRLRRLGRGLLMSMWGQRSLDAIRPSLGGFCQSSGHEGDFVSVRRQYEWTAGKYQYQIKRMDREIVDGKPHTWVGAFVYSYDKDENVFIGALRFPGEDLKLARKVANFVEIYGPVIPVDRIPKTTVTFGPMVLNGTELQPVTTSAVYPKDVPDYAEAKADGNRVVVTVGQHVPDRKQRNVRLLDNR